MPVDERARHRLFLKLEEVLGAEEAGILMDHLPPAGFGDLATKSDLELLRAAMKSDLDSVRHELTALIERSIRRVVTWTSSMIVATGGLVLAIIRLS